MRVLLTGMSGAGKSALVQELRRRGYAAYDARAQILGDIAEVEIRRSADLVLTTTVPQQELAGFLLGRIAGVDSGIT